YFLDATVARITEVGLRTLTDYHGNYSHYVVEHQASMERLREAHRRQKEEVEKATLFINKFRYQATKARQVQSRIKMLDKVDLIEIPPERKKIRFKFPDAPRPGPSRWCRRSGTSSAAFSSPATTCTSEWGCSRAASATGSRSRRCC